MYVNEEYKTMYCRIPKTGCTNWKKYFILLAGRITLHLSCCNAITSVKHWCGFRGTFMVILRILLVNTNYQYSQLSPDNSIQLHICSWMQFKV